MGKQRSNGTVVGIYTAPQRGEPTQWAGEAHVIPGKGIEKDRYFNFGEKKTGHSKTGTQITLIEIEAIEAMRRDGLHISADTTRRNIVTRDVSLNELVGKKFFVGSTQLLGVRLCEPCDYLASRTDPQIKLSMLHRGGLRADILTEGFIRINDTITTPEKD